MPGKPTTIDPQDCIAYDQAHLSIVDEGDSGWLLTDGSSNMLVLDNQQEDVAVADDDVSFGRGALRRRRSRLRTANH